VASACGDKTVRLWDSATGAARCTLEGHIGVVWAVAFSPDGRLLASAAADDMARLWDPATGSMCRTISGYSGQVSDVAFSPDGRLLASASDQTVKLWDVATGQFEKIL
jgi:WD40 repeat protein